jgi:NADP-dependent 3-hydroxy acid dehydrogenase YdfG
MNKVILVSRTAPKDKLIQEGVVGKQVKVLEVDLSDLSKTEDVIKETIKQFGQLDGLVLNHGTLSPVKRIENSTVDEWRKAFDINFFSVLSLVRHIHGLYPS